MKHRLVVFSLVIGFSCFSAPVDEQESFLSAQTFMSLPAAKQRWKKQAFNAIKFKAGTVKERASMAVSLIIGHKLLGKKAEEVRALLGESSGYFWSDYVPAYLIEEGWSQKKDTWQLVFLLNEQGHVNDVKIHKNCCSPDQDSGTK